MGSHNDEICVALTRMALAGDGVVLGLGVSYLAVKTWLKYRSHQQAFNVVKDTPLMNIADLHTLVLDHAAKDSRLAISNHYPSSVRVTGALASKLPSWFGFQTWPKVDRVPTKEEQIVIVRGKIQTKASIEPPGGLDNRQDQEAITPSQSNAKAVYLERIQTYVHFEMNCLLGWIKQRDTVKFTQKMCLYNEWRGLFGWGVEWRGLWGWALLKEKFVVAKQKVAFVLAGNDRECVSTADPDIAYVDVNIDNLQLPLPLLTVYHQFHPVPSSSYTLLQAMFGRRYPVGLLDEECILPVGQEITAVGILDAMPDGKPVIKPCSTLPIFLYSTI